MKTTPALFLVGLVTAALAVYPSLSSSLDGPQAPTQIPGVNLRDVGNSLQEICPSQKQMTFLPVLKDMSTTSDQAVNYHEVLRAHYLCLTNRRPPSTGSKSGQKKRQEGSTPALPVQVYELSPAKKKFLDENKFLVDPQTDTAENNDSPSHVGEEMLSMFGGIGGSWQKSQRKPENARLVTPDVVLHAFYRFFQDSLMFVEKGQLSVMLEEFLRDVQARALEYRDKSRGKLARRYEFIAAQLTVPLALLRGQEKLPGDLEGKFSPNILNDVKREISLILGAKDAVVSPLFGSYAKEPQVLSDYTQYSPRGHYGADPKLKAYFRAMTYLGRNGYMLATDEGITDALLLAHLLSSPEIMAQWQKLSGITSFYAGESDDLCYPEWRDFIVKTLGRDTLSPQQALNQETIKKIKGSLGAIRAPRLNADLIIDENVSAATKDQLLEQMRAFRIFGQRFTIDGWILQRLTAGLEKTDTRLPSTPTALFVPMALGSKTARKFTASFLAEKGCGFSEAEVSGILEKADGLTADIAKLKDSEWFGSCGSAWLKVLGTLTTPFGEGYPLYMQSRVFPVKQLETFLGSYTELKHAKSVYAKGNQVSGLDTHPGKPPPVPKGFVEPNLQFWYEFQRFIDYCIAGFEKHGLYKSLNGWKPGLMERARVGLGLRRWWRNYSGFLFIEYFRYDVNFFTSLAEKELKGVPISEDEYERLRTTRLRYMAEAFEESSFLVYQDPFKRRSGRIVDIHTDPVNQRILYEATGRPSWIIALVGNEDSPRLVRGVVFNHYEFTTPLGTRLTDADWQARVYSQSPNPPPKNFWYGGLVPK